MKNFENSNGDTGCLYWLDVNIQGQLSTDQPMTTQQCIFISINVGITKNWESLLQANKEVKDENKCHSKKTGLEPSFKIFQASLAWPE